MKRILDYLSELKANNNREWYHSHKAEQREAEQEFEVFLQNLMLEIGKFDSSILGYEPKELTFKMVRDTRFGHDKSPYNPAFRAHISSCGKLPVPVGYYVFIKPGNETFLGGGLFTSMFKDATKLIRESIVSSGDQLQKIMTVPDFQEHFTVQGEKLKNVPRGYEANHPQAELLKHKSWYLEYPVTDENLQRDTFVSEAADVFRLMKPFNDYLNQALKTFSMPQR